MESEGPQMLVKSKSEGTYEFAKRGEKSFFRMEAKSAGTAKIGDQPEQKNEGKMLVISDGEFIYSLTKWAARRWPSR